MNAGRYHHLCCSNLLVGSAVNLRNISILVDPLCQREGKHNDRHGKFKIVSHAGVVEPEYCNRPNILEHLTHFYADDVGRLCPHVWL